jgi:hypothetical protein
LRKLINCVLFQITWFSCVVGAAQGYPWLGPVVFIPILLIHVYAAGERRWMELTLIVIAGLLGTLIDSLYVMTGLLHYAASPPEAWLAPPWIGVMWMAFAMTFNESLVWLRRHYLAALILGAVGGPLAYWAGAGLGGLQWLRPPATAYAVLACVWALALPLLFWINEKLTQPLRQSQPAGY